MGCGAVVGFGRIRFLVGCPTAFGARPSSVFGVPLLGDLRQVYGGLVVGSSCGVRGPDACRPCELLRAGVGCPGAVAWSSEVGLPPSFWEVEVGRRMPEVVACLFGSLDFVFLS